jgi:glyceraldehyde 3-phosphate dehydrogenase
MVQARLVAHAMKLGINGFGRIGRLVFRSLWDRPGHRSAAAAGFELVHVNDPAGDAHAAAHLLSFDSVHGRWSPAVPANTDPPDTSDGPGTSHLAQTSLVSGSNGGLVVGTTPVGYSQEKDPTAVPWREAGVEMVIDCSGRFKTPETLQPYFDQVGLKRVVVACPVKGEIAGAEALNIVFGINHHLYDPERHRLITAASCTTNCLAPVVKVLHDSFGIEHGSITTLHDVTNTQRLVDGFHSDLRRARSAGQSLIPTTTGSARAIGLIFPELAGRLNGHAVRVPLLNASLTDAVFELKRRVTVEEVNRAFETAASGPLQGILGYETRPLVSVDYLNDPRSAVVDGLSTMVVNGSQLKVYAWYDNEWGYSSRLADLVCHVALREAH